MDFTEEDDEYYFIYEELNLFGMLGDFFDEIADLAGRKGLADLVGDDVVLWMPAGDVFVLTFG